jgi:phosphoglycolate phosphatase
MALFATARTVVGGDTTPHPKPHPAPLLEAARQLDIAPEDCIYVGDDERDIRAGQAAGMGTVAATYGYLGSNAEVARWGADASIEAPMHLLRLLKSREVA